MKRTIYSFSDPVEFLKYTIESTAKSKNRAAWTQKAWSKRLGYQSDRSLGMILKRQRNLTAKMVSAIAKSLGMTAKEYRYFDLLVTREELLKQSQDTSLIDRELQDILAKAPSKQYPVLSLDDRAFSIIAKWYHLPIKQLISSPSFKGSADWIRKRLRDKISNSQIHEALENLLSIGVIRKDHTRGYALVKDTDLAKRDQVPSVAVRQHHAQMLQRAIESVAEQTVEERELIAWTLRLNKERLAEAKEVLRTFSKEFNDRFDDKNSDHVFSTERAIVRTYSKTIKLSAKRTTCAAYDVVHRVLPVFIYYIRVISPSKPKGET